LDFLRVRFHWSFPSPQAWTGCAPVASVITVFGFVAPNFFTEANLLNITRQASINIVLAAGMTLARPGDQNAVEQPHDQPGSQRGRDGQPGKRRIEW
jgi:hypothetical protein